MIPLASILPSVAPLTIVDEPASAPSSAKPLEQYAQKLLADNKVAFPFGSTNQGNNRTSLDQFNFILDKLLELIKNDKLFDGKIKKLKLSKQDQLPLKKARDEVIKPQFGISRLFYNVTIFEECRANLGLDGVRQ